MRPGDERLPRRFWDKVELDDGGCWYWTGAKTGHGYAALKWSGYMVGAHRLAYQELVGPIPPGLELDHLCRRRHCVNPDHLEPVTGAENRRRGDGPALSGARWAAKTHCPHGHEYDKANTRVWRGRRFCRACDNARTKRRYRASRLT